MYIPINIYIHCLLILSVTMDKRTQSSSPSRGHIHLKRWIDQTLSSSYQFALLPYCTQKSTQLGVTERGGIVAYLFCSIEAIKLLSILALIMGSPFIQALVVIYIVVTRLCMHTLSHYSVPYKSIHWDLAGIHKATKCDAVL